MHLNPDTKYSQTNIRDMTGTFRQELRQKIEDVIPDDAFAVVHKASKRVLGIRHFNEQPMGSLVLCK